MNWQTQLNASVRVAPAAVERITEAGLTQAIEQLRAAAKVYDSRSDDFAAGKGTICRDMAEKLMKYGSFASDKQRDFALKLIEWAKPRAHTPGPAPIMVPKLFAVMQKHAEFHAGGGFKITRRNQDTLCWLIWNNVCVGKIENTSVTLFSKRLAAFPVTEGVTVQMFITALLREFEANPLETAKKYGRESGRCCSCGRDLTDPVSIEAGIGPTCATHFV